MINYKKSLLSLAAAAAITTSATAGYIPLASEFAHDEQWVLFGVTGLKATGSGAGTTAGTFSISDDKKYTIKDVTKDEKFTNGLEISSGTYLGKVKSYSVSYIQVRINTDNYTSKPTEPVHTMYVALEDNAGPAFAITYDAALEGRTMEYSISSDGSNAQTVVLDSSKTYASPVVGSLIQTVAGEEGSTLNKLVDIVDFDLEKNPNSYAYYDKLKDQTAAAASEYLRVYSYDTENVKWNLFDTRNSDDTNDFTELKKGKAYWAKMNLETSDRVGGLVLGSSSISTLDYLDDGKGLKDGWNLVSFSSENSTIRKSSTGLIVTLKSAKNMLIYDATGKQSITVAVDGGDATKINTSCFTINQAVKQGKLNGSLPKNFNLRAYPSHTADKNIVLISNKRFLISEENDDDAIDVVTTLTGGNPYLITGSDLTTADDSAAMSTNIDLTVNKAMSKYGEYALVINPLFGADTAVHLNTDVASIHLQNASSDATDADAVASADAIADIVTALSITAGGATFLATPMDIDEDLDGTTLTATRIIVASKKPFYMRDHTFTRVFDYTTDAANATKVKIRGTGSDGEVDIAADRTLKQFVALVANTNNLRSSSTAADDAADPLAKGQIFMITSRENASKFDITETIEAANNPDLLNDTTSSSTLAQGAIKDVYSIDAYADATVTTTLEFDIGDGDVGPAAETITFKLYNNFDEEITGYTSSAFGGTNSGIADADTLPLLKTFVEKALSNLRLTATVTVDTAAKKMKIVSSDITALTWKFLGGDELTKAESKAGVNLQGRVANVSADLSSDLQFNPVYTPNYVTDGPLYTMRNAGFDMKAMVTGSAEITTGTIDWASIDLTRKPSEWLASQDYNLFQTDEESGYWVYLVSNTEANPLSITKSTFTPVYTSHFNADNSTFNNIAGQISVEVSGLPQIGDTNYDDSAVVTALVNGQTVNLVKTSTNNVYSGDISSYELPILSGANYPININVANGMGAHLKNVLATSSTGDTLSVDMIKPEKPTVSLGNGDAVKFSSVSTDVAGYYVSLGQIYDTDTATASNKLVELTSEEAGAYALCSADGMNKLTTYNQEAYNLNVVAIDGKGKIGTGNASDVVKQNYIPMLKDAIKLADTNNGESDSTSLGIEYGADCKEIAPQTEDYGMAITSESDLQEVKIAYTKKDSASDSATPITLFVKGDSVMAKLTYSKVYKDSIVYIEVEGVVYSYKLPDTGNASSDPILLSTDTAVSTKRPAQQL